MALVSATVIAGMRLFLALFPEVPLRYPVRKWAAGSALFAASGYLILSGASVSTQRAYIMISIMLLAVLMDRRALTMRNVALARAGRFDTRARVDPGSGFPNVLCRRRGIGCYLHGFDRAGTKTGKTTSCESTGANRCSKPDAISVASP